MTAKTLHLLGQPDFYMRGRNCKIIGWKSIILGNRVSIGDFCWIESITEYRSQIFKSTISIGSFVSISDFTHISAAHKIHIDSGCLLGSKIYIGDHSHGDSKSPTQQLLPPGDRPLGNIEDIYIGKNTWIGDGAIILGGTRLSDGCIVAANAVVRLKVEKAAIVAGNPARVVRYI